MTKQDLSNSVDSVDQQYVEAVNLSKDGVLLASRVLMAATSTERRRGLLGRQSLSPDEGIYLSPCEWVHTFGMQFPIDILFLSSEGKVLALHHGLKPNRLSKIAFRAFGVLELSQGRLAATATEIGDTVQFSPIGVRRLE